MVRMLALAATVVMVVLATGTAHAQAPPPEFFEGRSNAELLALARDPNSDVLLRRTAATRLVMTLADARDFTGAEAAAREFARNIDPLAVKHIQAVRRRGYVHAAALGALAVMLGALVTALVARRRSVMEALGAARRMAPVVLCFFGYAGLVGGALATRYENGSATPFLLFAAVMIPLAMAVRVWSLVGSQGLLARALRGALALAATLAVGFLVVEQVNPSFLEGFGL